MWMLRCGRGGDYIDDFIDKGIVGVGWHETGSLETLKTREQIIAKVTVVWPAYKKMKAVHTGSQLNKVANVMNMGDRVITYDPSKRIYHVGRITGPYAFVADAEDTAHRHAVGWEKQINRDLLSLQAKNSLGPTLSVFSLSDATISEIEALINNRTPPVADDDLVKEAEEDPTILLDDTKERAKDLITDKVMGLQPYEMQDLVAGLLRAMGYKTRVSKKGPDQGKDILASPDSLCLQQPRIVVEVKHREKQMGSQEIRGFLGGRHKDDKGLFVSTGGFSKEARYEADRATIPVTLLDINDLVSLVIEYYESFDTEAQSLLPLRKIYWPV